MTADTVSSRRRFFFKAGAALSAPLAAGAALAGAADEGSAADLQALRDADAIRQLQQDLAREINAGSVERASHLFTAPSEAAALAGLRHLAAADFGDRDRIEIAPDGSSAMAEFHCALQIETPIEVDGTFAEMARQQGDGFVRRRETRVLEARYVRRDGSFRIERLRWGQSRS